MRVCGCAVCTMVLEEVACRDDIALAELVIECGAKINTKGDAVRILAMTASVCRSDESVAVCTVILKNGKEYHGREDC